MGEVGYVAANLRGGDTALIIDADQRAPELSCCRNADGVRRPRRRELGDAPRSSSLNDARLQPGIRQPRLGQNSAHGDR